MYEIVGAIVLILLLIVFGSQKPTIAYLEMQRTQVEDFEPQELSVQGLRMVPTCPDPANSGMTLLASSTDVPAFDQSNAAAWPFQSSHTYPYGAC